MVAKPRRATKPPLPEIKLSPKQRRALHSKADITIFGGGNGGGKTQALIFLPMMAEYIERPGAACALFAESVPKLTQPQGLVDKCRSWYAGMHPHGEDGYHGTLRRWTFPTPGGGESTITLSFVGEPGQWDGMEAALVCIDQVEQVEERQFFSVVSRNRTTCGARPRVFATANPPEDGRDHWLTRMLTRGGWIGDDGFPVPEVDGKVRYYARHHDTDEFIFADTVEELAEQGLLQTDREGRPIPPKSVTFVQALVDDHPDEAFREAYRQTLASLPAFERERRLRGNWYVTEEAGKYFNARMFPKADYMPSRNARLVRAWDNAWSTAEKADWTPGVLLAMEPDGRMYICDLLRFRGTISHVERAIEMVAEVDGRDVTIRLPKDAGPAGALQSGLSIKLGAKGYHVVLTRDVGDKLTRSRSYQGCAEREQIRLAKLHTTQGVAYKLLDPFEEYDKRIVRNADGQPQPPQLVRVPGLERSNVSTLAGWHDVFIEEHVRFGRDTVQKRHIKKDTVDAAVGGYEWLAEGAVMPIPTDLSRQAETTTRGLTEQVNDIFGEMQRSLGL